MSPPPSSTAHIGTVGFIFLASPATAATYLGTATVRARESTEDCVMPTGLLPLPPAQSTHVGTVLASECAGCVKLLAQSWGVHEVLTAWLMKDAYTYLTPTADILDDVARGAVYTGVVADDNSDCHHWSHYSFKKRSMV